MGIPTVTVSLGRPNGWFLGDAVDSILGVSTYLGTTAYTDISQFVRGITIDRGRDHALDRVEAGKLRLRLANRGGEFNPSNTASPYYPDIRPMAPLWVQATWSAVTYDLFLGFAEGWPQQWTQGPEPDAYVEVEAVDGFKILNLAKVSIDRGVEGTGARIGAVLDAIQWPASLRNLDVGESTVQAVTLSGTSALAHIQDVAASEGGVFFMSGAGVATFFSRTHAVLLDEANDTWGDIVGEKGYESLETSSDDSQLWNEVTVTAPNLAPQTAADVVSQGLFSGPTGALAPRSLSVSTLLTSEVEMLDRAEFILAQYSLPEQRVVSLVPEGRGDDTQWPRILLHDLHDRVLARKRPPGGGLIDQPSIIEGITREIAAQRFKTTWKLSSTVYQQGQWTLGDSALSLLGQTTTLVNT